MLIRNDEHITDIRPQMRGGKGEVRFVNLAAREQLPPKCRFMARGILEPGCSIGYHVHEGEAETYYILRGVAQVNDNGTMKTAYPGDTVVTLRGTGHALENAGSETLEFIATVILD